MDRRVFLGGLTLAALAVAQAATAQPVRKVARIGVLTVGYTTSNMPAPSPGLRPSDPPERIVRTTPLSTN
jgi:hypothetical protein